MQLVNKFLLVHIHLVLLLFKLFCGLLRMSHLRLRKRIGVRSEEWSISAYVDAIRHGHSISGQALSGVGRHPNVGGGADFTRCGGVAAHLPVGVTLGVDVAEFA